MDHPLVELAHAALGRLIDAPPAADAARSMTAELERARRRPLSIGIGGELPARTALFNALCGEAILDPHGRALGCAGIRARRGPTTKVRAVRDDGTAEELERPPTRRADEVVAKARAEAARGESVEREAAIARIDRSLPAIARVRPARWAIWLWPIYWIARWLARGRLAERGIAEFATATSRAQLEAIEHEATEIEAHARRALASYRESLRRWSGGGSQAAGICEIELLLAGAPLPEGIEVVELTNAARSSATVDAVFLAVGDGLFAPVHGGEPLRLATTADALSRLDAIAAEARALAIARRSRIKIGEALQSLQDELDRKDDSFRARIAKHEGSRLTDPIAFSEQQLAKVGPEIISSVNAVIEHSSIHLASELAQLQSEWIDAIARSTSTDELKAAIMQVSESWASSARRIAGEVRVLVMGGLGGSARDIYPELVAALLDRGLPEEHGRPLRAAPLLPPVPLLPSLDGTSDKLETPGWFAGLFRSFESRRTWVREKLHERIEHLRVVASAELLDAEPRMQAAIVEALRPNLALDIQRQTAGLDAALTAERAAIEADRALLAPLLRVRDAVRGDLDRLSVQLDQIERDTPAIAFAASAAETSP